MPQQQTGVMQPRRRARQAVAGQFMPLFCVMLVPLLGFASLALNSAHDAALQLTASEATNAAARSAAYVWSPVAHALPLSSSDKTGANGVVYTAQEVAALNGVPTNNANSCTITDTASQFDAVFFDKSGGPASAGSVVACAPAGYQYSLEVQIPPLGALPAACATIHYKCVSALAGMVIPNQLAAISGQHTTTVGANSSYAAFAGCPWAAVWGNSGRTASATTFNYPSVTTGGAPAEGYFGYGVVQQSAVNGSTAGFTYYTTAAGDQAITGLNLPRNTAEQPAGGQNPAGWVDAIGGVVATTTSAPTLSEVAGFPTDHKWAAGGTTLAVSPANVGDVMVFSSAVNNTGLTISTMSGGGVTDWNEIIYASDSTDGYNMELWYGVVTSAGSATITVTWSGTDSSGTTLLADSWTTGGGSASGC